MNLNADILLVTATDVESKAVIKVFQSSRGNDPKPQAIGDRIYYNLGLINGTSVCMVQSEMGTSGLGASQQTIQKGIDALSPKAVIMTGIAFGINSKKQSIGDVLVSKQLMLYEVQRVGTANGKFQIIQRGDRPHASSRLLNYFHSANINWDESKFKVHFGLILSGEKLVDNIDFREQLCEFEPEAIGGEMEGAGLYVACQDAKVDWILVKSICDWADGFKAQNKKEQQQLAANNAAIFVLRVLEHISPVSVKTLHPKAWNPPRTPDPFIGRENDLNRIKAALGILPESKGVRSKIISIHGVPGVGKSTFAAWIANDPDVLRAFPDAVLWSTYGQFSSHSDSDFEIRDRLKSWGSILGDEHLHTSMRIDEMTDRLAIMLRNKKALLICDDVWDIEHISAIRRLADGDVRLLITSRLTDVAEKVISYRDGIFELKVFLESDAISLLETVAPTVVMKYQKETKELVHDLEYLPLAINVTGQLLRREMDAGLDVVALIEEIREEGELLLKEAPPVDMMELIREAKSPTVAAWLKRSTQMLDTNTRQCFISLGYIAPKPATFGLRVLKRRWKDQNVNVVIRKLIDTGLIQPTSEERYQMHALLVTLAKSMGKEIGNE